MHSGAQVISAASWANRGGDLEETNSMEAMTIAALLGLAAPTNGSAVQLILPLYGDADRKVVSYQCEGVEQQVAVEYINASPNFLAVLSVAGQNLLFVTTLAADGARYSAGPFEWWTHGGEATFADLRKRDETVACSEAGETP